MRVYRRALDDDFRARRTHFISRLNFAMLMRYDAAPRRGQLSDEDRSFGVPVTPRDISLMPARQHTSHEMSAHDLRRFGLPQARVRQRRGGLRDARMPIRAAAKHKPNRKHDTILPPAASPSCADAAPRHHIIIVISP